MNDLSSCPTCGQAVKVQTGDEGTQSFVGAEADHLVEQFKHVQDVVDRQAEDEGLWFNAQTAAEAYLQQELRNLHAVIEGGE